ncbi:MAG: ACT domain-containing protein [Halioglobus sp.]
METSYIITFIGDDRPGLVEMLSQVVESSGGNWHESRLSQLGGKFAGLILVTLPDANGEQLENDLKALADTGLSVRVTSAGSSVPVHNGQAIVLHVLGPDRLGIVREISRALSLRAINVTELDSEVISAAMSGEALFKARIDAQVPSSADLEDLSETLEEIANQMTLDIDLERG